MKKVKVVKITQELILFNDDTELTSDHDQECCESHYLSFSDLTLDDFEGLEFDLTNKNFFTPIHNYGIALNPINGFPVRVPGYGDNNGYYSTNLTLVIRNKYFIRTFDITECQDIDYC